MPAKIYKQIFCTEWMDLLWELDNNEWLMLMKTKSLEINEIVWYD